MSNGEQPKGPPEPDEHPLVAELTPADGPDTVTLIGMYKKLGGTRRRVYLTADQSSYADFDVSDYRGFEDVPADSSPIPGVATTRVTLRRGAPVDFTYAQRSSVTAHNQVDLDVRSALGQGTAQGQYGPDHTIFTSLLCPFTVGTYAVSPSRLCTHTIYGYGPPPPLSTVPCWYTIPTHTI
jgi:hypothetical protein